MKDKGARRSPSLGEVTRAKLSVPRTGPNSRSPYSSQSFVDKRQDQDSESLADLAEETGLRSFDPYLPENPVAGSSRI